MSQPGASEVHVDGTDWTGRKKPKKGEMAKQTVRTLYISRRLENAEEFISWAKAQGFDTTLQPGDLHVTIAYSKKPVEWPGESDHEDPLTVAASKNRIVTPLGDGGAVVLRFDSEGLKHRWQQIRDMGASWDWDGYQPHVTISWDAADVDLSKVEPFAGELVFGPERFAEINEDWKATVTEKFETDAQVFKVDKSLGLVFGWAIVSKVNGEPYYDSQGDFIPEDAMLKAAADFMANSRMAKEMHAGSKKGSVVFAWPMTADIAKAMGIETKQTGLMIAMKPDSPEMLAKFKSGEFTGFSIGGRRVKDKETA